MCLGNHHGAARGCPGQLCEKAACCPFGMARTRLRPVRVRDAVQYKYFLNDPTNSIINVLYETSFMAASHFEAPRGVQMSRHQEGLIQSAAQQLQPVEIVTIGTIRVVQPADDIPANRMDLPGCLASTDPGGVKQYRAIILTEAGNVRMGQRRKASGVRREGSHSGDHQCSEWPLCSLDSTD